MRRRGMLLVGAALIVGTGVLASARADDDTESVTLFTAAIHGNGFHCNSLNVSHRPLLIAMSIIDGNGNVISPVAAPNPKTLPGVNASNDLEPAPDTEAYCKVEVSDTDDPNDVRVVMKVNLIRTFDQGGRTNLPVFLSWTLEGR